MRIYPTSIRAMLRGEPPAEIETGEDWLLSVEEVAERSGISVERLRHARRMAAICYTRAKAAQAALEQ
jgi:hypothetical protein